MSVLCLERLFSSQTLERNRRKPHTLSLSMIRTTSSVYITSKLRTMRLPSTLTYCVAVLTTSSYSPTAALPFRSTRGGTDQAEDGVVVDDSLTKIIQPGSQNRNAIVETYFADATDESSAQLVQEIRSQAAQLSDFMIQTRRHLHQYPELMYQEEQTSQTIQDRLKDMGIAYTVGWAVNNNNNNNNNSSSDSAGGYGIVADLGTGQEPCVLLRADMDALPIVEETVVDFPSTVRGRMHACGHDGHTTMLLGAAALLKSMEA